VSSHVPATHGMSAAQQARLGLGTLAYKYDTAPNGIGALAEVDYAAWGKKFVYRDVHHRDSEDLWYLHLPAQTTIAVEPVVTHTYTPAGKVATERWDDGTTWTVAYDFRDLPTQVQWLDKSLATPAYKTVAAYARSVAGLPRTRTSAYATSRA